MKDIYDDYESIDMDEHKKTMKETITVEIRNNETQTETLLKYDSKGSLISKHEYGYY